VLESPCALLSVRIIVVASTKVENLFFMCSQDVGKMINSVVMQALFQILFFFCTSFADSSLGPLDIERLNGFAEHKTEVLEFDLERETGYKEWLEEQYEWEKRYDEARKEYRTQADVIRPPESIPAYKNWLEEQQKWEKEQEAARAEMIAQRKQLKRPFSEEKELEVYEKRPRYDLKDRSLYTKRASGGRTSAPAPARPDVHPGETGQFTPPPPPPPDDDFPPPPPPPMGDDDFPPPPPPPSFDDFDNDFPPPPPPPPMDFAPEM
jgi:hypothetical protein